MTGFLIVTGGALATVVVVMTVSFVIGRVTGKYSIIDAVWGPGFALIAVVSFGLSVGHGDPTLRVLVLAMVVVWGLRLGGYILVRNHGLPEDPRYAEMLADAGGPGVIVRKVQLPQGLVMWFVSLPVQVAMLLSGPVVWVIWSGLLVYLVGLTFEAVGDAQLAAFKRDPANRGRVLDRGLWRYTRHPNYFGDACVWVGIFLTVSWSWAGWVTVLSPVLMVWLLIAKTGKALTERRMSATRPGYAAYVARTSGFLPRPPRRTPQPRGG
jgi:steroid 5-alpha reductase family enzyme